MTNSSPADNHNSHESSYLFTRPETTNNRQSSMTYNSRNSNQSSQQQQGGRHHNKEQFARLPNYQKLIPLIDECRDQTTAVELFSYGDLICWNKTLEVTNTCSLNSFGDSASHGSTDYPDWGLTRIQITNQDAAFVLGKAGRTKRKLMKVSSCFLNLTTDLVLEVAGTLENRAVAVMLIQLIIQQRMNNRVTVDIGNDQSGSPPEVTVLEVPKSCVAFVTGQHGSVIRNVERDWDVIMFFAETDAEPTSGDEEAPNEPHAQTIDLDEEEEDEDDGDEDGTKRTNPKREKQLQGDGETDPRRGTNKDDDGVKTLIIFGSNEERKGAELKMMSAVEQKKPGYFTDTVKETLKETSTFDTDTLRIPEDDFSYALGKEGNTRRKLALAAGCVLEYIGHWAFIAGDYEERKRGREYLKWLLQQRRGSVCVDIQARNDVMRFVAPSEILRECFGPRGIGRTLERETNTFCFINDRGNEVNDFSTLLIFSCKLASRLAMKEKLLDNLHDPFMTYQYQKSHPNQYNNGPMTHDMRNYMSPPQSMPQQNYCGGRDRSPMRNGPNGPNRGGNMNNCDCNYDGCGMPHREDMMARGMYTGNYDNGHHHHQFNDHMPRNGTMTNNNYGGGRMHGVRGNMDGGNHHPHTPPPHPHNAGYGGHRGDMQSPRGMRGGMMNNAMPNRRVSDTFRDNYMPRNGPTNGPNNRRLLNGGRGNDTKSDFWGTL